MEDKANGPAVISALRHDVTGLVAITPEGGKVARARAVSPQVESCNVYLPHPSIAPWVPGFIDECSGFPNGKYDDQVDQMTQVLNRLRNAVAPPKKYVYRPCHLNGRQPFHCLRGVAIGKVAITLGTR